MPHQRTAKVPASEYVLPDSPERLTLIDPCHELPLGVPIRVNTILVPIAVRPR